MKKFITLLILVFFALLFLQMRNTRNAKSNCFRNSERGSSPDSLFEGENSVFASAGKCDHCHGKDPSGIASTDGEGGDINVVDDWSSTMMANAAVDPYWRAKVSEEILLHPGLQAEIENTCTRCHAPLGNYAHSMTGGEHYSISQMLSDPVALDGVSCLACHRQLPQPETAQHTGRLFFDSNPIVYGPYTDPLVTPMALYSGYVPEHGSQITDSKLCAGCHSLVTKTVDLTGNLTDHDFVEQATWHEWLNSSYPAQNKTCQSCHLAVAEGQQVILATGYDTPPRSPFGLHTLAGGNTLMLKILRDNREALGIFASESQFNETISATLNELQNNSLQLQVTETSRTADTLYVDVKLINKTGHKLPSGYPARKMSVHFSVKDENQNEIFRSGRFDESFYIDGEDTPYEPHHNVIRNENEVQIYEMIMGDINLNRTNVLNRGYVHLKDNRLVPQGYSQTFPGSDTTEVVLGILDQDFNHSPEEGSGSDVIHYRIPLNGYTSTVGVQVDVFYQSIPPTFTEQLFGLDTPEINAFAGMMEQADQTPVLMKSASINVSAYVGLEENNNQLPQALNNRANELYIKNATGYSVTIFDLGGKKIHTSTINSSAQIIDRPLAAGTYLIQFSKANNKQTIQKIVIR